VSRPLAAALALVSLLSAPAALASPDDLRRREVEIESLLVAKLGSDAQTIRVVLLDGRAILVGTVKSRATQELAKEVVLSLPGIERATNHVEALLDPKLTEGQAQLEGKDAELEIRVKRALARDAGDAVARALEVEAVDGVVSLRGTAPDAAGRARALDSAARVPGVVRIVDLTRAAR
jgi:osmotically-inducible protein OsmY